MSMLSCHAQRAIACKVVAFVEEVIQPLDKRLLHRSQSQSILGEKERTLPPMRSTSEAMSCGAKKLYSQELDSEHASARNVCSRSRNRTVKAILVILRMMVKSQ